MKPAGLSFYCRNPSQEAEALPDLRDLIEARAECSRVVADCECGASRKADQSDHPRVPVHDETTTTNEQSGVVPKAESDSSAAKPNEPFKSLFGSVLTIFVGEQRVKFLIHEYKLRRDSIFFRQMLAGPWAESQSGGVELPEDDPGVFESFCAWLDRRNNLQDNLLGMYKTRGVEHMASSPPRLPTEPNVHSDMLRHYILGDKLQAPAFKNSVIDTYSNYLKIPPSERSKAQLPAYFFRDIFQQLPRSSNFTKLAVDMWIWDATPTKVERLMDDVWQNEIPAEFGIMCHLRLLKYIRYHMPALEDGRPLQKMAPYITYPCENYHEHDQVTPTCTNSKKRGAGEMDALPLAEYKRRGPRALSSRPGYMYVDQEPRPRNLFSSPNDFGITLDAVSP